MLLRVQDSASTRFRIRLRELRELRGWTQERASEACGVGYKMFQHYEEGIKRNPGLLTLEKIARGFGLELHELLAPTLPRTRQGKASGSGKAGRKPKKPRPRTKK